MLLSNVVEEMTDNSNMEVSSEVLPREKNGSGAMGDDSTWSAVPESSNILPPRPDEWSVLKQRTHSQDTTMSGYNCLESER